ncbi:MAG: hypothetical protein ACI959_001792 [Limisphaerales bacterium]|jgi:hypothetical protein
MNNFSTYFLAFLLMGCMTFEVNAQFSGILDCPDSVYCVPSVIGLQRSKFFQIEYEFLTPHDVTASSVLAGTGNGRLLNEHRYKFDLRFPIYNKPHLKFALGFAYSNDDFIFDQSVEEDYPLFATLNDRNLKSTGIRFYMVRAWQGKHYFIVRASVDLNGDYSGGIIPQNNYVKYSIAPMFGFKKDERVSMGGGLAFGYEFGAASIFPFFVYNHTISKKFGVEMVLPASARVRYTFSKKTLLYSGVKLSGASYTLNTLEAGPLSDIGTVQLQTSEIRLLANFEQEIYDFLWFKVEVGARFNFVFDLTTEEAFRPDVLVSAKRAPAPYFRTGIFLVPPRKFLQ